MVEFSMTLPTSFTYCTILCNTMEIIHISVVIVNKEQKTIIKNDSKIQ